MLTLILAIVFPLILVAEFYLGVAVINWQGKNMVIERAEAPGQYWAWMVFHTIGCIGLPILSWLAGF